MTLTEFLLARIAEDEADLQEPSSADYCDSATGCHYGNARVLAECEAKRQIVELHARFIDECHLCEREMKWPCDTIRALALPFVDHPDYRPEWKP